jgi:nitroreductase
MTPIKTDQLLTSLKWRYATKQFDPSRKVSAADMAALEEALVLSPSSFGLQPWKFIIIQDAATREKLLPVSWGQKQIVDCSHLVVFTIKTNVGEKEIDAFLKSTADLRGGSVEQLAGYRGMMVGSLVQGPNKNRINDWASHQTYIALGNLMTSAALLGIDACPMEGIEPGKYDEILGLTKLGLHAVVVCPLGYRLGTDKYATLAKVRFPKEDVIIHI